MFMRYLINDMYSLASTGDLEGFMTGVVLIFIYGLLIVLEITDFLNKRG